MIGHIFRRQWLVWLIAVLVVIAGIVLSWIPVIDRNWLARSGSVVVVLGISSSVGQMLHFRMLSNTVAIRKRYRAARIRRKYRGDAESVARLIQEMEERINEELAREQELVAFNVGILEASLVSIGTLIWGFGDLLALLF